MGEDKNDHQYGPEKAADAIEQQNGRGMGDGQILYVKLALAASKRNEELLRATFKYNIPKKRCNLYVKNFDPKFTRKDLCRLKLSNNQFGQNSVAVNNKSNTHLTSVTCLTGVRVYEDWASGHKSKSRGRERGTVAKTERHS